MGTTTTTNNNNNNSDSEDDFLSVKRRLNDADLDAEISKGHINSAKIIEGLGGAEPFVIDSKRREKALQSKKKMLKFRGNPTKLVFDDDGNSHEIYELQDEEDFQNEGPADEQRLKFVESESARVREADADDKQLARQKKREKREKRKAREKGEPIGGEDEAPPVLGGGGGDDGEDPLALLRSLPMAGEDDEPPRKKKKKWFQDEDDEHEHDEDKKKAGRGKVFRVSEGPDTLEDLEALATGLLDCT